MVPVQSSLILVHTVIHRGFKNVTAGDKSIRLLLYPETVRRRILRDPEHNILYIAAIQQTTKADDVPGDSP